VRPASIPLPNAGGALFDTRNLRTIRCPLTAGTIAKHDGVAVPVPEVRFIGRRHGPRKDQRWASSWSPEQIENRLNLDFPDDPAMRISHEAIYQNPTVSSS